MYKCLKLRTHVQAWSKMSGRKHGSECINACKEVALRWNKYVYSRIPMCGPSTIPWPLRITKQKWSLELVQASPNGCFGLEANETKPNKALHYPLVLQNGCFASGWTPVPRWAPWLLDLLGAAAA